MSESEWPCVCAGRWSWLEQESRTSRRSGDAENEDLVCGSRELQCQARQLASGLHIHQGNIAANGATHHNQIALQSKQYTCITLCFKTFSNRISISLIHTFAYCTCHFDFSVGLPSYRHLLRPPSRCTMFVKPACSHKVRALCTSQHTARWQRNVQLRCTQGQTAEYL